MKHKIRVIAAVSLVLITLLAFGYYIKHNRYLITKLLHTPPVTIIWLILLYIAWFGALYLIVLASLRICNKTIKLKEGFLLNAYSTLVNFFVPGQGGIAVRGVYLKRVKKLAVRNYIFITLVYYMFYAVISSVILLVSRPWWQPITAGIAAFCISLLVLYIFSSRAKIDRSKLSLTTNNLMYLFLATLLQTVIQIIIYGVELHSVNRTISLSQMITYTGAANFSLFVALTPGAIGIREAFLLFTRHLHHISSANIVGANVIDRAIFIVLLGALFIITLGFHAKFRSISPSTSTNEQNENIE